MNSDRVRENLAEVRQRIADAAARSGRLPTDVQLVAVTKYAPPSVVDLLLDAGVTELGESRPQQLWSRAQEVVRQDVHWHMIGHLQRNKIRRTLPLVHYLHSIDSLRLAEAIDREAAALGQVAIGLLEVNVSGDTTKHGFTAEELPNAIERLGEMPHLAIRGLMAMAHREGGRDVARRDFAAVRQLRDRVAGETPGNVLLEQLSMGMSRDFEEAIEEGATLVRVGSDLLRGIE